MTKGLIDLDNQENGSLVISGKENGKQPEQTYRDCYWEEVRAGGRERLQRKIVTKSKKNSSKLPFQEETNEIRDIQKRGHAVSQKAKSIVSICMKAGTPGSDEKNKKKKYG